MKIKTETISYQGVVAPPPPTAIQVWSLLLLSAMNLGKMASSADVEITLNEASKLTKA